MNKGLLLILVVAAALRVGVLAVAWDHPQQAMTGDSGDYIALSKPFSIMQGSWFSRDGRPEIFRTPGYPLFLMFCDSSGDWKVARAMQVAIDVALVYLTFLLGAAVVDRRAGLWAAGLQAVSAVAIAGCNRVLSDSLFAFMATAAVLLLVRHFRSGSRGSAVGSALVLGAACYVRPVGEVYLAIFAFFLLARAISAVGRRPVAIPSCDLAACDAISGKTASNGPGCRAANLAIFVAVAAATLAPWTIRNMACADYAGFSSFASDSVYYFAAPEVVARRDGISSAQARERMKELERSAPSQSNKSPSVGEAARFRERAGMEILRENPSLYAWLHLKGVVGFYLPGATDVLEVAGLSSGSRGTSDVLRQQGLWAAVDYYFGNNTLAMAMAIPMTLMTLVVYAGVVIFAVRKVRWSMSMAMWLIVVLIVVTSLLSGPYGFPRYRMPIEPLLSLCAAAGFIGLASGSKKSAGMIADNRG